MALQLMYITNRPEIAQIAQAAGVDRIFVDLEYIGKVDRQGGMDTVQSCHTLEDIRRISETVSNIEVLVRVNPIHDKTPDYPSSEEEINIAIQNGADILMLPFFKTKREVERFMSAVDGRVKVMLLVETPEAVENIDEILEIDGIDYVHIGLNDLSLGYKKKFMFELLSDGTVEKLCQKCKDRNIEYGFGGIAAIGKGQIPAEMIIKEHYRLGSTAAILSRSFCNTAQISDLERIRVIFEKGMREIRIFEAICEKHIHFFEDNRLELKERINKIVK